MSEEEKQTTFDRRKYFREYMRDRYKSNPEKARAYKKTLRLMNSAEKSKEIDPKDCEKFGIYLADVIKIRSIISGFPAEVVKHLLSA